ncbi:MAG: GAF domain-containing protein [Clostridia bacterium]|nr:GAF domain-containing protein [Clostridia bacterium]
MDYALLTEQLEALAREEGWYVPLLSNAAALLYHALPDLNWAGFYLVRGEELILGPFQGKVACIRIRRDRGVCGAAWRENAVQRVDDVHAFPGHIACDGASNAEIVIPLRDAEGRVRAVMDLDSPVLSRFTPQDQQGLERFARALERAVAWDG